MHCTKMELLRSLSRKMKNETLRDIFIGISIFVGLFLVIEIALQIYAEIKWSPDFLDCQIPDSELVYRLKPGFRSETLKINSLGLRGKEVAIEKPENTLRIVAIGDSIPFGFLTENPYPEELQRLLKFSKPKDSPIKYEVINAGIPGYSSWQVLKLFRRDISRLNPDFLIVYVGLNDVWSHNPLNPSSKATEFINTLCRKVYISTI